MADSDFPKPPDVPDYVPVTATWRADGNNRIGDGIGPRGSQPPPAYAYELAEPNPTSTDGWLTTGDYSAGYKTEAQGAVEAKFRTHVNATHVLRDDPIRAYGMPGTSHWHTFLGNKAINAWSTYKSVRLHPSSHAAGGILNGTGYWQPSVILTLGGNLYAKMPDFSIIYYNQNPIGEADQLSHLPFGLRYVAGWNMEDHHETAVKAELALAGAGIYSGGYNGFAGWKCLDANGLLIPPTQGGTYSLCLKNADGSDPWGGLATAGNTQLIAVLISPQYWDGVNLWSPGGYKHFRHAARHLPSGRDVGPDGWFKIPQLELFTYFSHGGFADYGTWRLSSDDHLSMIDPNHPPMLNGSTWHADWMGGWRQSIMTTWQRNGNGVDGNTPHDMIDSVISSTQQLIVSATAPDGRTPQVNTGQRLATIPANLVRLPSDGTGGKGPFTLRGGAG